MHTYHQILCDVLIEFGYKQVKAVFSYERFRRAWYAYLDLLDVNLVDGFMCQHCSTDPQIIICDGTSVAFQKRMWKAQGYLPSDETVFDSQIK